MSSADVAFAYHLRTRHAPYAFARSRGWLDWESQPNPFRDFDGAPKVVLDLVPPEVDVSFERAFREGELPAAVLDRTSLSRLLQDSLGLSAWKEAGATRWALRVNPSSGNLHPTEAYVLCGAVEGLTDTPALWHYHPYAHALEKRAEYPGWARLRADLPQSALLVGFTSIVWRESWKYGERAFRYCQHDVGHALAALAVAAAGLGWVVRALEGVTDPKLAAALATDVQAGPEREVPELLVVVYPAGAAFPVEQARHLRLAAAGPAFGVPRALSAEHHAWPVLDEVEAATRKLDAPAAAWWRPVERELGVEESPPRLRAIVHGRRSAVAMDGRTGVVRDVLLHLLDKCRPGAVPFRSLPWAPRVELLLFVHRVAGLDAGLYTFRRGEGLPVDGEEVAPGLVCLRRGDVRGVAQAVSCDQAIAHESAFAVAMVARVESALREDGAWMYRRLHWEAGAIGQVLYLEAEANGVRGTGIGCFYDDAVVALLGEAGAGWHALYNFTVGGAVDDERLQTLAPYGHR